MTYIMIPLDIFHENMDNKTIETPLDAWLTFMSSDDPDRIIELITGFPEFKSMYETLYQMCLNMERVMNMFSEELRILDRNTVKYMIDEQQQEIDRQPHSFATACLHKFYSPGFWNTGCICFPVNAISMVSGSSSIFAIKEFGLLL